MTEMITIPKAEYLELKAEVARLKQALDEALRRLNQNSSNSNFPSSMDLFQKNKIVSMRKKSGKPSGGQPGHKGTNLAQTDTPDIVETYTPDVCTGCDAALDGVPVDDVVTRQEINVQAYKKITAHRVQSKTCPCCGLKNTGKFPDKIKGPVQYGETIQADIVYAILHQMVSFKRFRQEMESRYGVHANRSEEALKEINIFGQFKGLAIHDCYPMYFSHEGCVHAICYAHILRELKALHESGEEWANEFATFLVETNEKRETFSIDMIEQKIEEFKAFLQKGLAYHASLPPLIPKKQTSNKKKRGKAPQRKGKNLLDRLIKYEDAALIFIRDATVPFTNNQAEQGLRMIKVKLKIAAFRSADGAKMFARIRSYIETAKKLGLDVFQILIDALNGRPFSIAETLLQIQQQGP